MYKIKLKKWGICKYNIVRRTSAIARRRHDLKSSSPSARIVFSSNGRDDHLPEFPRHFKQKYLAMENFIEESPSPPMHIEASLQVPRYIKAPMDLEIPERLLYNLNVYLMGPFDTGRWSIVGENSSITDLSGANLRSEALDLENLVHSALRVSASGNIEKASRAWTNVSEEILSLIPRQNIYTYTRLSHLVRKLVLDGKVEIAHAILRQLLDLTASMHGTVDMNSPLRKLYGVLLLAKPSDIDQLVLTIQLRVAEILDNILGNSHVESLNQRAMLALHIPNGCTSLLHSEEILQRYVSLNLPLDRPFWLALFQHLPNLLNNGEYVLLIREIAIWIKHIRDRQHHMQFRQCFYLHSTLAVCHYTLGEMSIGKRVCEETLEFARRSLQSQPRAVATYLRLFETNLKAHGHVLEIVEVCKLRYQAEDEILRELDEIRAGSQYVKDYGELSDDPR